MFYYMVYINKKFYFFHFVLFLTPLTLLGFNYGNCLHDSAISIKLDLLLAMR